MSLMGAAAIAGGAQIGGGILGGLMARRGMSKGQWRDHERMQGMQIEGSKQLTDYQNQKQLEMWKATGPEAQRKQLEEAGLSASLIYGGGGGAGGQTVGGGGAPATNTGPVESDSARMMASAQMASTMADVALKTAQAKNIEADTENKSFDNEVRATIGTAEYSEQIKAQLNKERVENVTEYRKAVAIMDALGGTDPEKMYALDKFGNYDNTEFSKLGKQQAKFLMDQYTKLEADINKVNQDIKASKQSVNESKANEELLKVETEIRDFKADLSNLGLNETTVKVIELLLKAMIGGR